MQSPANAFVSWNALPSTIRSLSLSMRISFRSVLDRCFEKLFGMHLLDVALLDLLHQV
jgi:hypothetical protein